MTEAEAVGYVVEIACNRGLQSSFEIKNLRYVMLVNPHFPEKATAVSLVDIDLSDKMRCHELIEDAFRLAESTLVQACQ